MVGDRLASGSKLSLDLFLDPNSFRAVINERELCVVSQNDGAEVDVVITVEAYYPEVLILLVDPDDFASVSDFRIIRDDYSVRDPSLCCTQLS